MAQGEGPLSAYVELPQGLWKAPRWAGIETIPAGILFLMEIGPIILKSLSLFIVTTLVLVFWWWTFSKLFLRDERYFAIFLKTRHFHGLKYLRGESLACTRYEHLKRVV